MTEASPPAARRADVRRWLWLGVKLLGTAGGFAYVLSVVDLSDVGTALARMPLWSAAAAIALTAGNLVVGGVRWRILLAAYGAPHRPSLFRLVHLYYVGFFYNTYLPGGVGGDVVRGVASKEAFGDSGVTGGVTVVFVERVLGLSGLLVVVAVALLLNPIEGLAGAGLWTLVGLGVAAATVIGLGIARRIARWLPGPLGRIAASIPVIVSPLPFAAAFALSLVTNSIGALTGWVLLVGLDPSINVLAAAVVVPLAASATYLPFTVGGAGVREAAFVALAGAAVGMSEADATASSLALWGSQLVVAAAGGVAQLVAPLSRPAP